MNFFKMKICWEATEQDSSGSLSQRTPNSPSKLWPGQSFLIQQSKRRACLQVHLKGKITLVNFTLSQS